MTKLCRDCKHIMPANHVLKEDRIRLAKCAKDFETNLVTGDKKYQYCSVSRTLEYSGCGSGGKFWEPAVVEIVVEEHKEAEETKKPGFWSRFWSSVHFGIGGRG